MPKIVPIDSRRRRIAWRKRRSLRSRSPCRRRFALTEVLVVLAVAGSGLFYAYALLAPRASISAADLDLSCTSVSVTDGDTFRCGNTRVRMYGIDAPEREGHCRPGRVCVEGDPIASARNLEGLMIGQHVACKSVDIDRYGRTVGRCFAGDVDLSCAQIEGGFAVRRYGSLWC